MPRSARDFRRAGFAAMVLAALALGVSIALSAFVLSDSDEYGGVGIPGEGTVALPRGDVDASFSTFTGSGDAGVIPPLELEAVPVDPGVDAPRITQDRGAQITVNGDFHQRIWKLDVPEAGEFEVRVDGAVDDYQEPEVTFGYSRDFSDLYPLLGLVFVAGLITVIVTTIVLRRRRPAEVPDESLGEIRLSELPPDGRLEPLQIAQLEQLGRQRQAGALTDAEYEAEKAKVLGRDS